MKRILLLLIFFTSALPCLGQLPTINSLRDLANEGAMIVAELESGTVSNLSDSSIFLSKPFTIKHNLFFINHEIPVGPESDLPTLLVVDTLGDIIYNSTFQKEIPNIKLIPNPTSEVLSFQNNWLANSVISIHVNWIQEIVLKNFPNWSYLINIIQNGKTVVEEKLV